VIFFGTFAISALIGMPSIDRKLAARDPEAAAKLQAATSILPFGAILAGRNRLVLAEIGWLAPALALIGAFFKYSAMGLSMRAVVESPRMTELSGINADRVSALAWAVSSFFAGLAGVLIAIRPGLRELEAGHLAAFVAAFSVGAGSRWNIQYRMPSAYMFLQRPRARLSSGELASASCVRASRSTSIVR
jgi:ABC-type branched-subunit amino acid transport system permease subunit